jgi:hypothetical protein
MNYTGVVVAWVSDLLECTLVVPARLPPIFASADGGQRGSTMIPHGGATCPPAPESIQVEARIYAWMWGCSEAARGKAPWYTRESRRREGAEQQINFPIWWRHNWPEIWGFGWSTCGVKGFLSFFFLLKKSQPLDGKKINDVGVVRRFPSHRTLIWSVYRVLFGHGNHGFRLLWFLEFYMPFLKCRNCICFFFLWRSLNQRNEPLCTIQQTMLSFLRASPPARPIAVSIAFSGPAAKIGSHRRVPNSVGVFWA